VGEQYNLGGRSVSVWFRRQYVGILNVLFCGFLFSSWPKRCNIPQLLTDSHCNKIVYSNATHFFKLILYLGKVDFFFLTQNSPHLTKTACLLRCKPVRKSVLKGWRLVLIGFSYGSDVNRMVTWSMCIRSAFITIVRLLKWSRWGSVGYVKCRAEAWNWMGGGGGGGGIVKKTKIII